MDIRYVQSMKKTSHHVGLNQTPYKAKFCTDPRTGLPFATLPGEAIKRLETMTFCLSSLQMPGNNDLFVSLHCKRLETMTFWLSSLQMPGNNDLLSLFIANSWKQ